MGGTQMSAALAAGLDALDLGQTVTFTLYRRCVLPADGFVFWVRADLLSPSALPGTALVNRATPNAPQLVIPSAPTFQAEGSLHQTSVNKQDPDESFSIQRMVFTSKSQVDDLESVAPETMYIAQTGAQRYVFSTRSMRYRQSGLFHYAGDAVYPTLDTQVIDNPAQLNLSDQVVSNSTPIWLGLARDFPIYPSLLVPENLSPPYGVINIGEEDTTPLQAAPVKDVNGSRWQLVRDRVRITTFGVRNDAILDWLDYVSSYTLNHPDVMGVMNSPVVRDADRGQVEISAKAQKKSIIFEVSYYQARMDSLARQLIREAFLEAFLVPDQVDLLPLPV